MNESSLLKLLAEAYITGKEITHLLNLNISVLKMKKDRFQLVTIFASGDKTEIVVVKSILDVAGIQYMVKGETLRDLAVGMATLGIMEIQVKKEDELEAYELLKKLRQNYPGEVR